MIERNVPRPWLWNCDPLGATDLKTASVQRYMSMDRLMMLKYLRAT